jgi:hypothetical protein
MQLQHPGKPLNRAAANASPARRWLLISCALAVAFCQPCQAVQVGTPAKAALQDGDAERAAKLKPAAAFKKQAEQLRAEKKLAEAAAVLAKAADLERSIFGNDAPEVAETLALLGRLHQDRDDWTAAAKVQQAALAIRTKYGGAKHWQTTDARLALEYTDLLSKLPAEKLAQVRKADELYEAADGLEQNRRYGDALTPAKQAVALRKRILGESSGEVAQALHLMGLAYIGLKG